LPRRVRRLIVRVGTPNFTVGAICLIEDDDGRLLLVRQAYRGAWGAPGGLLKRHEDAREGMHREVREEIGIDVEVMGEPTVVVAPVPQRVDIVFRANPTDGAVEPHPRSPEILEVAWFALDDLPDLQHELAVALRTAGLVDHTHLEVVHSEAV
jgi:ADP-ribose pyrophosphatase YjhB (NUDIX family)